MKKFTMILMTICLCASMTAFADSSAWTLDGNTEWTNAAAWSAGVPGAGDFAYFTNTYSTDKITAGMSNNQNIVVGAIVLGNTRVQLPNTGTNLTLYAGGSRPIIDVSSNRLDVQVVLEGTDGFVLEGDPEGVLMIGANAKPISGPVLLQDVLEVIYNNVDSLMNADINILNTTVRARQYGMTSKSLSIDDAGILNLTENPTQLVTGNPITVNSNGILQLTSPAIMTGSNIVVNNGAEFVIATAGTSTLENDMSIAGNGIFHAQGAFHTRGGNVTNNGDVYFAEDSRFGQYGGGVNYLVQNGGFSGPGSAVMLTQGGDASHARTFYLNGPDTRTGNTTLNTLASHATYEIGRDNRFPNTLLTLDITHWTSDMSLKYHLNGYDQDIQQLTINAGSGGDEVRIVGGGGTINASGVGSYAALMNGGKVNLYGVTLDAADQIIALRNNVELTVTGSYVHTESYILMNHGPANSTLNVGENGRVDAKLLRLADTTDPANLQGVVNLNAGGTIKTSLIWVDGTNAPEATFRFNGGLLENHADATYDPYWIWPTHSTVVADGGANIKVNRDITITAPLLHDTTASEIDGGLTKLGTGSLTLTESCTYNGKTTVEQGTLVIQNTSSSIDISALPGATIRLEDEAVVVEVVLNDGSSLNPGGQGFGTITAGSILMETGSSYEWEVSGDGSDVVVADALGVSDAVVNINITVVGDIVASDTNMLFQLSNPIVTDENTDFIINGAGTDAAELVYEGDNILITGVVPEPAIFGLLAILGLAILRRK